MMSKGHSKANYKDFFSDLGQLMIKHGIRDIRYLNCTLGDLGQVEFQHGAAFIREGRDSYFDFQNAADEVIRESLTNVALDSKNPLLFEQIHRGDIYAETEQ